MQYPTLVIFILIIFYALWGTITPGTNFATLTTWTLWWSLLPLSYFLFARLWCTICPFSKTLDLCQSATKFKIKKNPPGFLRKNGVWIMTLTFLILTWADLNWYLTNSPRLTGVLLLIILGVAVFFAIFYKRRTWCRYACPIGALSGIYSTTSFLELRIKEKDICLQCKGKYCYTGAAKIAGCPLFEFPQTMDTNRNCNLCGNCVKNCPYDNIVLRLRFPAKELWSLGKPLLAESVLGGIMVALVFIQTFAMTPYFLRIIKWVSIKLPDVGFSFILGMDFYAKIIIFGLLFLFISFLSSGFKKKKVLKNFSIFGYAYIPLAVASHIAHNFFHLYVEGAKATKLFINTVSFYTFFDVTNPFLKEFYTVPKIYTFLQILLVFLGASLSILIAYKITRKKYSNFLQTFIPHLLLIFIFMLSFCSLIIGPMTLSHLH